MTYIRHAYLAFSAALLLTACGESGTLDSQDKANTAQPSPTVIETDDLSTDDVGETVQRVENCVLETRAGRYAGPCERIEWGGSSFSIRRAGGKAFVDGITEVVVEVDRPGEKAGGSFRRGPEGDLVPAGPLSFRDDCACWVRRDFRVGAFSSPKE